MSLARLLVRRVAIGVFAAWAVLSAVFAAFTVTEDWRLDSLLAGSGRDRGTSAAEIREMREQYIAERGLDRPLHEQYLDWLLDTFTLQWGESFHTGGEVLSMVASATLRTAAYVVPALAIATVAGLLVGVYVALSDRPIGERGTRVAVYLGFGLLNAWLGYMAVLVLADASIQFQPVYAIRRSPPTIEPYSLPPIAAYGLPVLLVATTVVGGVASYARSYARGYADDDLTKGVRARGGGRLDVARHVVRNASIPLVSIAFAESLATLALSVFVIEALLGIDGLGLLFFNAVWARDLPVVTGATMVVVGVGVAGNVLQDLAYSSLDPRVDTGSR